MTKYFVIFLLKHDAHGAREGELVHLFMDGILFSVKCGIDGHTAGVVVGIDAPGYVIAVGISGTDSQSAGETVAGFNGQLVFKGEAAHSLSPSQQLAAQSKARSEGELEVGTCIQTVDTHVVVVALEGNSR